MEPNIFENCKACNEPEDKQNNPIFRCNCKKAIHLACVTDWSPPGDILGDVFYDYTCNECNLNTRKDTFNRSKISWFNILTMALYHLQKNSHGISNHGFFHYKTHLASFMDRNWHLFFKTAPKQKKNWVGTLAGQLSCHSNTFFLSGSFYLGEQGWWKLMHKFSPGVADHINQELVKVKPRRKFDGDSCAIMRQVTISLGYRDLLSDDSDILTLAVPHKKVRLDSDTMSYTSNTSMFDTDHCSVAINQESDDISSFNEPTNSMECVFRDYSDIIPHLNTSTFVPMSDSSSNQSYQPSYPNYDSDSRSRSPYLFQNNEPQSDTNDSGRKIESKYLIPLSRESLFSARENTINLTPWINTKSLVKPRKGLSKLTEYEEIQLFKQIENLGPVIENDKMELKRFKTKLTLRRLKRNRHLPVFDLDDCVKKLAGYILEDSHTIRPLSERVLDRYQTSYVLDNLCGTVSNNTTYSTILVVNVEPTQFRSPNGGSLLKPFIRRDTETTPLWLKVMTQLLVKANRFNGDFVLPPRSSIDYTYVRPHHIAAINNLCAQYFWPGIDLTETLQYPEYSCIVLYKKLVIGFAFLVPDVRPNEAYISFIFTKPEWRRSHIATFMLYHLLQTCSGRDVTLHVSPTNPAVFLYQRFGFKVEELVQDFYEKYFEVNSKDCRHALFLRLTR